MSEQVFKPEEFARILSLPEDHPDRRRVEGTPEFEARRCMLAEFESPSSDLMTREALATAERELEARLRDRLAGAQGSRSPAPGDRAPSGRPSASDRAARGPARPLPGRNAFEALGRWLRGPALRPALSVAAVLLAAGIVWWGSTRGPASRAVRGEGHATTFALAAPRSTREGLELAWTPFQGADAYRLVFYGADLRELARIDPQGGTSLILRAKALPTGLRSHAEVLVEVTALHRGDPLAVTRTRPIRLP